MCIGEGQSEGVRSVRIGYLRQTQHALHHFRNCNLLGRAVTDDGLFHFPGRYLVDFHARFRSRGKARAAGLTYSRFMEGMKAAKVDLDRKVLADIAATDTAAFSELVGIAQKALKNKQSAAAKA